MKQFLIAGALYFGLWTAADAIDINGKVRSAGGENATVTTDADLLPKPGDKAENLFQDAREAGRNRCRHWTRFRNHWR